MLWGISAALTAHAGLQAGSRWSLCRFLGGCATSISNRQFFFLEAAQPFFRKTFLIE